MYQAFFVALFAEMFGTPLTIYILTSLTGLGIALDGQHGHLLAVALAGVGVPLGTGVANSRVRHPQYLGFILVIPGFNVQ